jgi:hypothetical protein
MPGGYDGYQAAPVRRRLTPGRISSLPVTGGLPLSISSSTGCPELGSTGRGSSCGGDAQRHGEDGFEADLLASPSIYIPATAITSSSIVRMRSSFTDRRTPVS